MPPGDLLQALPTWVSRWLGYRRPVAQQSSLPSPANPQGAPKISTSKPLPQPVVWIWTWIGAFGGIAVIQAVFGQASYFVNKGVPPVVPSFGATAVLIYGVIDSPFAQPRAVFFGHFIGSLVGVCIAKLFGLLPTEERYDELAWLAASIACATAIVLMQMTKTVHPPAGATAFLPVLDGRLRALGWYFIPVILLSSVLALAVALLVNNVQRRYPLWWIQPPAPAPSVPEPQPDDDETDIVSDWEKQSGSRSRSRGRSTAGGSTIVESATPIIVEVAGPHKKT